jgi:hypothetical protein
MPHLPLAPRTTESSQADFVNGLLTVTACLKRGGNEQGEAVSDADMQRLLLTKHTICPQWNYTLSPRPEADQTA